MTIANFWQWSATAALNVDVNGLPLGESLTYPSHLNNIEREEMSQLRGWLTSQSFPTAGGTANALTLTPSPALTAYATGIVLTWRAAFDNSSATVNLNTSALGDKLIRKVVGGVDVALAVGDILDDRRYWTVYDAAANAATGAHILLNPSTIVGDTITVNTAIVPDANDGAAIGTTALQWSDLFLAEGGVIDWDNGDVTLTQIGNLLELGGTTNFTPATSDTGALGSASKQWADLFLASGGVINFNNGAQTITGHAGDLIQFEGAASGYTFDTRVQVGTSSTGTPGFTLISDTDTGVNIPGGNSLELVTAGAVGLNIGPTGRPFVPLHLTTGSAANGVLVAAGGELLRSTSAMKYKTDEEPLDKGIRDRVLNALSAIWYRSTCEVDEGRSFYGASADALGAIEPRLVHWKTHETVRVPKQIIDRIKRTRMREFVIKNEETGEESVELLPQIEVEEIIRDTHEDILVPLDRWEPEGIAYDRLTVFLIDKDQERDVRDRERDERLAAMDALLATQAEMLRECHAALAVRRKGEAA